MHIDITVGPYRCPFENWTSETGRIFEVYAYDTETTDILDERPDITPDLVIGTVCDGRRGYYLTRDTVLPFFQAHADVPFICHNAAFDLAVSQQLLGNSFDLYALVEAGNVWDTLILKRLLALATEGHTAQGEAGLDACARTHLGIDLDKAVQDAGGRSIRRSFAQYLFAPLTTIPADYLRYAAGDALVTWHLFWELNRLIREVLRGSSGVRGYVDEAWLRDAIQEFGPLTHHVQLKASIVCDVLRKNGIGIDQARQAEKLQDVLAKKGCYEQRLRERSFPIGGQGAGRAMQAAIDTFHAEHPDIPLQRTGGGKWSAAEEDIADLAGFDPFFSDYTAYRKMEKLESTYLSKMNRPRLHPRFNYLRRTGRTSCDGFNLQNLPRESSLLAGEPEAVSIRGCFVPGKGKVFIDADYSQIELVVLAYILKHQFKLGSSLHDLINAGHDIHKFIAAAVLDKNISDVTKAERNGAKAVSFGRPGGMGVESLQRYAKNSFKQDLSVAEVQQRIHAYHRLCPELTTFLDDEVDAGLVIAETLGMTPAEHGEAIGYSTYGEDDSLPQSWLGGMLLRVLREACPTKRTSGQPYSPAEIEFFWQKAQQLPITLKPDLATKLAQREANEELWQAVRDWAGRRPVFTVTGRLRANALFGSSRNTPFQGPAADGAILGLWELWRAGYKLVSAVHDQVVIECKADDRVLEHKARIERLMIEGMLAVVPGMNVKVETVVSLSLNKAETEPRYCEQRDL
jgi:DNA polymerase I-like protein with 3'-5' exonuclease and polymerase domains